MIDFPSVKLQDQTIRTPLAGVKVRIPEPFVLGSTMTADAREKSLVPAARGLNVAAVDEGLGAHDRIIHTLSQVFASVARGDRSTAQTLRRSPSSGGASGIPRAQSTRENRGIEAFSMPRFSRCAGAISPMYPRGFRENPRSDCGMSGARLYDKMRRCQATPKPGRTEPPRGRRS